MSFVLESHIEKTLSNHSLFLKSGIPLKCFSRKSVNPWKKLAKVSVFLKNFKLKSRTLAKRNSYKGIFLRIFLKFWVISDNFLKF